MPNPPLDQTAHCGGAFAYDRLESFKPMLEEVMSADNIANLQSRRVKHRRSPEPRKNNRSYLLMPHCGCSERTPLSAEAP